MSDKHKDRKAFDTLKVKNGIVDELDSDVAYINTVNTNAIITKSSTVDDLIVKTTAKIIRLLAQDEIVNQSDINNLIVQTANIKNENVDQLNAINTTTQTCDINDLTVQTGNI